MNWHSRIIFGLLFVSGSCYALSKSEIRAIIYEDYPDARITEIEKETYRKKKIYEVDFKHGGENFEAIISLEGEIIEVHIDD